MKVSHSMSILLWLYARSTDEFGQVIIYCRITLGENLTQFSTGKKIEPDHWSANAARVKRDTEKAREINEYLNTIKGDLRKVFNQLTATHKHVTADMIKLKYLGKYQDKKTLMELFTLNNSLFKEKYKQGKAALKTWARFNTLKNKLKLFLKKEYRVTDKPLSELNSAFGENFRHYLQMHEKLTDNTINKYLNITRQVLGFGEMKK